MKRDSAHKDFATGQSQKGLLADSGCVLRSRGQWPCSDDITFPRVPLVGEPSWSTFSLVCKERSLEELSHGRSQRIVSHLLRPR